MGRHSAPSKKKKLAPSLVLGLSILSGSSPIISLPFMTNQVTKTPLKDLSGVPVSSPQPNVAHRMIKLIHSTRGGPSLSVSNLRTTSRTVSVAAKYVGRNLPYRMGGNSLRTGIDCSHFVWMVLKQSGHNVPYRSSSALAHSTKRVSVPRPGDLVLYRGHVGIYAGNGMMIHHGRSGGAFYIRVYKQNFIGYGRV